MSYRVLETTIIGKNNLTELDAEQFKEYYKHVEVVDGKIIIDRSDRSAKNKNCPELFWNNYSLKNPDKIIVDCYRCNYVLPAQEGIAVTYNGYQISYLVGAESFVPYYNNIEITIYDCIETRTYKASELQILFYLLNVLNSWDFYITDAYFAYEKITSKQIADNFVSYLCNNMKLDELIDDSKTTDQI